MFNNVKGDIGEDCLGLLLYDCICKRILVIYINVMVFGLPLFGLVLF